MKNESKNVYDLVIYVLFFILVCILFYSFIKLIYYKLSIEPRNSTNVSSSLSINSNNSPKFLSQVTYYDVNNPSRLNNISSAKLVYEYLSINSTPIYKAIFDSTPKEVAGSSYNLSILPEEHLPNFKNTAWTKETIGPNDDANFIYSTIGTNHVSNFFYKDGFYTHYVSDSPQLDSLNNKPILISNVVIQLVDDSSPCNYSTGDGDAYLCHEGNFIKIKWQKESGPIKLFDKDGNEISLSKEMTWWIIATPEDKFLFK